MTFSVVQGADEVIGSESHVVTRQSPPVLIEAGVAGSAGSITIAFDLDKPFTRPGGQVVKPAFDSAAVSPNDTPQSPKVRPLGGSGMRVEYFLVPLGERESLPDGTGRVDHLAYLFSYKVLQPSMGHTTPAPVPFDWLPQMPLMPSAGVQEHVPTLAEHPFFQRHRMNMG